MSVRPPNNFGKMPDGTIVHKIVLRDDHMSVSLLTLGAILQDVRLSSLGYSMTTGSNDLAAYFGPMTNFGTLVGPVANRLTNASADIDGQTFNFTANEGPNCLHGGFGMNTKVWNIAEANETSVTMTLRLDDGADGFPGNRDLKVSYAISAPGQLTMQIEATTDRPTLMNLANHSYWNMDGSEQTRGHQLQIAADHYLAVDPAKLPTGEIPKVDETAFDFRQGRSIGADAANRYDHNLCLSDSQEPLREVAKLTGGSGTSMTLETTEPGLQVYDAENVSTSPYAGYDGFEYGPFCGIAMEAQGWPDAPNRENFPQITLRPGETYSQTTRWTFQAG